MHASNNTLPLAKWPAYLPPFSFYIFHSLSLFKYVLMSKGEAEISGNKAFSAAFPKWPPSMPQRGGLLRWFVHHVPMCMSLLFSHCRITHALKSTSIISRWL